MAQSVQLGITFAGLRSIVIEVHPEYRSRAQCDALFAHLAALGFERVASVRKVHAFRKA
jgi:hypothetical protein